MKTLVVRRWLSPQYHIFLKAFARENGMQVVVDRRVRERRRESRASTLDLRVADRRRRPALAEAGGDLLCVVGDGAANPAAAVWMTRLRSKARVGRA